MNSDRNLSASDPSGRRAAHRAAWVLACAAFPLIWMGGLVTSYSAGMAVPDWPSTYGYNLFLYPLQSWLEVWDVFLEHGHRLLGAAVGVSAICLAFLLWRRDDRRAVRWLGAVALGGVCFQGTLGGLRVTGSAIRQATIAWVPAPHFLSVSAGLFALAAQVALAGGGERRSPVFWARSAAVSAACFALAWLGVDMARDQLFLAKMHGSTAPALFALAGAIVTVTSPEWVRGGAAEPSLAARRLQRLTMVVTGMIYLQIVLGVNLRHVAPDAAPWWFSLLIWAHLVAPGAAPWWFTLLVWLHLIVAGAIVLLILWQWLAARRSPAAAIGRRTLLLAALFFLQLVFGATTWVTKYGWPLWFTSLFFPIEYTVVAEGLWQILSTTAHVGTGSLCLVLATSTALWSRRLLARPEAPAMNVPKPDGRRARRNRRR